MKDNEIADKVNELRDIAKELGQTAQLRERIAACVVDDLKQIEELKGRIDLLFIKKHSLEGENIQLRIACVDLKHILDVEKQKHEEWIIRQSNENERVRNKLAIAEKALKISNKELAKHIYPIDGQDEKYINNLIYFAIQQAEKELKTKK